MDHEVSSHLRSPNPRQDVEPGVIHVGAGSGETTPSHPTGAPVGDALRAVVRYYDRTWVDYRLLWLNRDNLAIHFGYRSDDRASHAESLLNTNRVLADMARIAPGDRVLDAGCGIGGSSVWLAEQRGATVVGITPVRSQVSRARANVQRRGLTHLVAIECADYGETGLPAASFDVVWALESVCHAVEKARFYREAARLLRPGGRVVLAEYIRSARALPPADELLLREWLSGWMIPDLDTCDEHVAAARSAGFGDIEVRDVTPHMRRSLRRLYKLSLPGIPIGLALRRLGLRDDVLHANAVASHRQYVALQRGCWYYGMIAAVRS